MKVRIVEDIIRGVHFGSGVGELGEGGSIIPVALGSGDEDPTHGVQEPQFSVLSGQKGCMAALPLKGSAEPHHRPWREDVFTLVFVRIWCFETNAVSSADSSVALGPASATATPATSSASTARSTTATTPAAIPTSTVVVLHVVSIFLTVPFFS